ncbi:MAG TPA: hypothetical protein VEL28_10715 [Candidatus Binatia bacterium]|nr:hypothetical protein [Candidatus Binatia bacterium]
MGQTDVPDVARILLPVLARVDERDRPLLLAIAERMAAERYRSWAGAAANGYDRDRLLACADREDEIASRVEALRPDHEDVQARIHQTVPDLAGLTRNVFEPHPWQTQFAIQAQGERLGAATWRALAPLQSTAEAREAMLECARLEEASAQVLESILAEHRV